MAIKYKNDFSGIINVYKEKGFTSHDVVAIVRKVTGCKTGHTGTLDPDAEGVLPICLGKCTRLSDYIMADEKTYVAVVNLGETTTTEDASGEVLEKREVTVTKEQIANVLESFVGTIFQTPPMYSAIKINGQKLYDLARQGKVVERAEREITIKSIEMLPNNYFDSLGCNFGVSDFRENSFAIKVICSKGTYIRTLCKDIGDKLCCGGHMGYLLRSATGNFELENSIKLDELKAEVEAGNLEKIMISASDFLSCYEKANIKRANIKMATIKRATINEETEKFLRNGNKISIKNVLEVEDGARFEVGENVAVYNFENLLCGLYEVEKFKGEIVLSVRVMLI